MNMLPGLLKNVTFDMQLMILIFIWNTSPARGNNPSEKIISDSDHFSNHKGEGMLPIFPIQGLVIFNLLSMYVFRPTIFLAITAISSELNIRNYIMLKSHRRRRFAGNYLLASQ